MAKIVNFATSVDADARLMDEAFEWAQNEQRRLGCFAEPVRYTFDSDWMSEDNKVNYISSVFIDSKTGNVLLRTDWPETMGLKYEMLVNFDEIKKKAPKSAEYMTRNALRLYRYCDGKNGGTSRYIDIEKFFAT